MANNRMYLVHEASGQRVLIAKHYTGAWDVFDDLPDRLHRAFVEQASGLHECTPWGSTGWHVEYEDHNPKHDDPLKPSTVQG